MFEPYRKTLIVIFICMLGSNVFALDPPQWWKDVHQYDPAQSWYQYLTFTSDKFGPNALPVPELFDGRIPLNNQAEISTDFFWGFGDQTQSLSARMVYAVLPGRLSISGWGVWAEHYRTTIAVRDQRASMIENPDETFLIGDFYLSTQLSLLRERRHQPDLNLEIVLKTSSSKTAMSARYFDTPGYYFNLTAAKSIHFQRGFFDELRFVGNLGFLCYQLNQEHQNDAPMFGGKFLLTAKKWTIESGIHGYSGWLNQGDKPLVLREKLNYRCGATLLFLQYQHALRDYPFKRLQTGVSFNL
ncbi:MAG TPA: hypothetical protein VFP20_06650 [Bacteroidales bacterium]|nr:hypothetical protein [Bacteroidales bacterium]